MRILLMLTMVLSSLTAQTDFNKVGTAGLLFLSIPGSASAQAMGRAYSGIEQGAEATFFNPALLGIEHSTQVFTSYTGWLQGLSHQSAAISFRVGRFGVGISQMLLTCSPMTVTTTQQPQGTGETFGYLDLALGFSVSRAFSDRFSLGGTVKYIYEGVQSISAHGFGVDIGSFYWIGYNDLRIFMVLQNFGPEMRFGGSFFDTRVKGNIREDVELRYAAIPLPITFTMGVAGTVWKQGERGLLLAVEANHPADYSQRMNIGAEFNLTHSLFLRGGYKINYEQESWSAGCGFKIGRFKSDLAYVPMKKFTDVLSYSINYILK